MNPIGDRDELAKYLARTLDITRFRDYCPNGLQVEGRQQIRLLVTGVTASLALLEKAVELGADAVLVHHGYFWRGEDARVVGPMQRRLKLLLGSELNLYAYHLPLDMHAEFGNNAQLAQKLGLLPASRFGEDDIGWLGRPVDDAMRTVGQLADRVAAVLGREPLVIGERDAALGTVGWCTGAAQGYLADAIAAGAGTYLSGEISEPTVHLARESGVAYLACGHHATERYGVEALGKHLAQVFGMEHRFIDIPNPV
ncbi:Nif3-like dinuclear metal center hexameric protein [Lacisediminimonas sp.]|uniref:Nif3-like dinuclear metal center hexameric protein n=1 Tax=Lacisediminimonas sp. TaxID=3060582 RepID=UPI00271E28F0|nr:Nif3-like dinuclear metal center hexameric protein [Lacisediminimonas sp.]MDO8298108.1 Nif3-like dinuclear metal center hexameric protein [Lacisediminimonas sp.]MDO9216985.1 Nif3-like dinuclear metal center hexameric protein [Lacisediminimonas sp.]